VQLQTMGVARIFIDKRPTRPAGMYLALSTPPLARSPFARRT
jgi:hypothetical protein